jgi:hypothetical protein
MKLDIGPWITILAFVATGFVTTSPLCAQSAKYHIQAKQTRRVKAELVAHVTYRPVNPNTLRWCLVIADAPELDRQSDVRTFGVRVAELPDAKAELLRDTTPQPRSFHRLAIPAGRASGLNTAQALTISVTYAATLYSRTLVSGAPKTRPAPLTDSERKAYLEPGKSVDFEDPSFQAWLDKGALRRHQKHLEKVLNLGEDHPSLREGVCSLFLVRCTDKAYLRRGRNVNAAASQSLGNRVMCKGHAP